jgi:hypothetical protein
MNANDLHYFPQTCVTGNVSIFPSLQKLSAALNGMLSPCESAVCLLQLTHLDLGDNDLSDACSGTFNKFPALQFLDLSGSSLGPLSGGILVSETLKYLSLADTFLDITDIGTFAGCPNLELVDLDGVDFSGIYVPTFVAMFQGLPLKVLSLSRSKWPSLAKANPFSHFPFLETLYLSSNAFTSIPDGSFDAIKNLKRLDLLDNQISLVSANTFSRETRERLQFLSLDGNPFVCSCDLLWFRDWLVSAPHGPLVGTELYCNNNKSFPVTNFTVNAQECLLSAQSSINTIESCGTLLFIFTLAIFLVRFRWHLRLYSYAAFRGRNVHKRRQYLANNDFDFDIFVSYASEDATWVYQHLAPELEGRRGLRLCLCERDFIPGRNIVDNIAKCVERSRKVLMVFSRHFTRSPWCQFELTFCLSHVMDCDDVLVVVMLGRMEPDDLTTSMSAMLQTTTYIQWPREKAEHDDFWRRLRVGLQEMQ